METAYYGNKLGKNYVGETNVYISNSSRPMFMRFGTQDGRVEKMDKTQFWNVSETVLPW